MTPLDHSSLDALVADLDRYRDKMLSFEELDSDEVDDNDCPLLSTGGKPWRLLSAEILDREKNTLRIRIDMYLRGMTTLDLWLDNDQVRFLYALPNPKRIVVEDS